jgi:hypothetical protein
MPPFSQRLQRDTLSCCPLDCNSINLNKSFMKQLLIFTLVISIVSCCKKNEPEQYQPIQVPCPLTKNLDTIKLYIQGTWQWLEEKRYNRGLQKTEYLTPQNQGYTLALKLSNDTARYFINNRPDSVYTFKIQRLTEISGTNFPEDNDPVLVLYRLHDGLRNSHVPLKICSNYLLLQHQYVSSIVGERIWKKQ